MLYLFSKLLPLLFLPLGISLSLLLFALILRRRLPVVCALLVLWFSSLGFISQLFWRWLEFPFQRQAADAALSADAIVVLSGGRHPAPGPLRISEWIDSDRFFAGLDLYRSGKAPRLIFTGGTNPLRRGQPPEAQLYLQEALQFGVPSAAMLSTLPVVNTAEEAIAVRRLLRHHLSIAEQVSPRILLVTSAFHMRRAQHLFERQGLKVLPFPVDFQSDGLWAGPLWRDPTQLLPSASALGSTSRALREVIGRLVYRSW